jgi:hypothetical protein
MTMDVVYNLALWLTIASAAFVVWYFRASIQRLWAKFLKQFQDAMDEFDDAGGPPTSPV